LRSSRSPPGTPGLALRPGPRVPSDRGVAQRPAVASPAGEASATGWPEPWPAVTWRRNRPRGIDGLGLLNRTRVARAAGLDRAVLSRRDRAFFPLLSYGGL